MISRIYNKLISYRNYWFKTYFYNQNNYSDTFLSFSKKPNNVKLDSASLKIYVFWTGNNDLTPNRKIGLESLKENSGVEVKLITMKNLNQYILPDYPLHRAYEYLSLVHRSDYLRCYFMLHYGGGYADIKKYSKSWKEAFNKLNKHPKKWIIGYREIGSWGVPAIEGKLGRDLKKNYLYLIGNGAFIYKPHTPLAQEWMNELHRRLDFFYEKLKNNPAEDAFGSINNYPISWSHIMGEIHHPLILKYYDKVLYSKSLKPSFKNYRQ